MRRLLLLALIASACAGCGGSGSSVPDGNKPMVSNWVKVEHLPSRAVPGARVFESAGCTACHVYAGSGASALGAPDLTAIGSRGLSIAYEIRHLRCPSCVHPGSPMPGYTSLGAKRLRELAIFLEASKGTH